MPSASPVRIWLGTDPQDGPWAASEGAKLAASLGHVHQRAAESCGNQLLSNVDGGGGTCPVHACTNAPWHTRGSNPALPAVAAPGRCQTGALPPASLLYSEHRWQSGLWAGWVPKWKFSRHLLGPNCPSPGVAAPANPEAPWGPRRGGQKGTPRPSLAGLPLLLKIKWRPRPPLTFRGQTQDQDRQRFPPSQVCLWISPPPCVLAWPEPDPWSPPSMAAAVQGLTTTGPSCPSAHPLLR